MVLKRDLILQTAARDKSPNVAGAENKSKDEWAGR